MFEKPMKELPVSAATMQAMLAHSPFIDFLGLEVLAEVVSHGE